MTFGLIISFVITFTLLPTLINLIKFNKVSLKAEKGSMITNFLVKFQFQIKILYLDQL